MHFSKFSKLTVGTSLATLPALVLASDPTPLFVLFIEIPIAILSIILIAISYSLPRIGRILAIVFLIAIFLVMNWASDVGYLESAGAWLYFSCLMGGIAFFLARSRNRQAIVEIDVKDSDPTSGT